MIRPRQAKPDYTVDPQALRRCSNLEKGNLLECIELVVITDVHLSGGGGMRALLGAEVRGKVGLDRPGELFFGSLGKTWCWSRLDE